MRVILGNNIAVDPMLPGQLLYYCFILLPDELLIRNSVV